MIRARKENYRELVKLRNDVYLAWMSRKDDFLKKQHLRGNGVECCRQMQRPGGRRKQGSVTAPRAGTVSLCMGVWVGGQELA